MAGSNGCSPNVIMSQQGIIQQPAKEKKPHIKKPLNAFMLFMKEKRQEVIKECTLKESAAINQILGKMVCKDTIEYLYVNSCVCSVCACVLLLGGVRICPHSHIITSFPLRRPGICGEALGPPIIQVNMINV